MVQVGQLTMAPDSDDEIRLQYADGSTSGYIKVDLVAKASRAAVCEAVRVLGATPGCVVGSIVVRRCVVGCSVLCEVLAIGRFLFVSCTAVFTLDI